jgi:peptidyl-prolyl cis-trans isomerase C
MRRYLLVIVVLAALGACQQKDPDRQEAAPGQRTPSPPRQAKQDLAATLATVGDVTITVGELQEQLNRQSPYIRARYTSLEQKREFLDSLIRFEVLAAEAGRRGFDKDPEVVRTMKSVMVQKLMRDEFERAVPPESIPEAELRTYYEANLGEYVKPEEVRVSAIVVKSAAQARKIAAEAQGDAGKTNKGFRELVQKHSTDEPTKLRGGDLRYFTRDTKDVPAPVVTAAFGLGQTGAVSAPIDAGNGTWWILKQTGQRKAMTKTFDDVKQAIRSKLHREKRLAAQEQFVGTLRQQAKIQINEANLAKVKVDTSQKQEAADPHDHGMAHPPGAGQP